MASLDGAQAFPDTCAIKAQEVILQQFFCRDFDEAQLRKVAYERGWYNPGSGTPCEHVGRLLEEAGIPISQKYNASAIDLFKALSEGKKVIVGLDGGELRNHGSLLERFVEGWLGPNADHHRPSNRDDGTIPDENVSRFMERFFVLHGSDPRPRTGVVSRHGRF
jgi:hypothetical protein